MGMLESVELAQKKLGSLVYLQKSSITNLNSFLLVDTLSSQMLILLSIKGERTQSDIPASSGTMVWNLVSETVLPDEPFHNFRASRSGDRRILCSSGTSNYGY